MTNAIAGYKAAFKASSSVGGTKTRVSELQEITWSDKHEPFDATSHDSNGARERIGGMTDFEAGVEGMFRDDDATQVALFNSLNSREKIDVQLVPAGSSGADAWSQSGFVSKWSIGGPVDGPARFSSSIVGTGGASAQGIFMLALDTFTDSDQNLNGHTPDLGFGGWTYSGAADEWTISSNQAAKKNGGANIQFCRCDLDIDDDGYEVYTDYTRSPSGDNPTERAGLYFLAHKTTAIANGEGVEVAFIHTNPNAMKINLVRRDSAGVAQQTVLAAASFSLPIGSSLRLGAVVSGVDVQVWTEPAGGGSRTNRGAPITLTVDLRDGDHKRIGMTGKGTGGPGTQTMDKLTVVPG